MSDNKRNTVDVPFCDMTKEEQWKHFNHFMTAEEREQLLLEQHQQYEHLRLRNYEDQKNAIAGGVAKGISSILLFVLAVCYMIGSCIG